MYYVQTVSINNTLTTKFKTNGHGLKNNYGILVWQEIQVKFLQSKALSYMQYPVGTRTYRACIKYRSLNIIQIGADLDF